MARTKGIDVTALQNWDLPREQIIKSALRGARKLAEVILSESKKLVPIESHTLQESGTVQLNSKKQYVVISYNTPYARKQHEDNTLDHSESIEKHGQGQAKYLERPFDEKAKELTHYVEMELAKAEIKSKYGDK